MAKHRLHTVSINQFKYDRFNDQFKANISDLGCNGIDSNCSKFFQKLETGVGFILFDETTRKQVIMRLVKTNKIPSDWHQEDFDVTSWIFKPNDNIQDFELKLINDL